MNKEEAKKLIQEEFMNNVMANLDSALIFTYVQKLEQENKQLKEQVYRYKKLLEYLKSLDFYEFELDYDYEENPVNNYFPADMEYHINNWLEVEKLEKGDSNE